MGDIPLGRDLSVRHCRCMMRFIVVDYGASSFCLFTQATTQDRSPSHFCRTGAETQGGVVNYCPPRKTGADRSLAHPPTAGPGGHKRKEGCSGSLASSGTTTAITPTMRTRWWRKPL